MVPRCDTGRENFSKAMLIRLPHQGESQCARGAPPSSSPSALFIWLLLGHGGPGKYRRIRHEYHRARRREGRREPFGEPELGDCDNPQQRRHHCCDFLLHGRERRRAVASRGSGTGGDSCPARDLDVFGQPILSEPWCSNFIRKRLVEFLRQSFAFLPGNAVRRCKHCIERTRFFSCFQVLFRHREA